jgi:hypothetical protein
VIYGVRTLTDDHLEEAANKYVAKLQSN